VTTREAFVEFNEQQHDRGKKGQANGGQFVAKGATSGPAASGPYGSGVPQYVRPVLRSSGGKAPAGRQTGPITTPVTLGPNDSGDQVVALQKLLALFGYKNNENGRYGAQTASQVKELQTKLGMKPTGKASPALQHKLADAAKISPCIGGAKESTSPAVNRMRRVLEGHPYPGQKFRHGWIPVGVSTASARQGRTQAQAQAIRDMEQHVEKLRREGPPPFQRDPERYVETELHARSHGLPIGSRIPHYHERLGFESLPSGHWRHPTTGRLYGNMGPMGWSDDILAAEEYLQQLKDPEYWRVHGEDAAVEIGQLTRHARDLRMRRSRRQEAVDLMPSLVDLVQAEPPRGAVATFRRGRLLERFHPDQLRAPGGSSIGGRWIKGLLGHHDQPDKPGNDVRHAMGRFTTAHDAVISARMPSRRPKMNDRVVDSHDPRRIGHVMAVNGDEMRVRWLDTGETETRHVDSVSMAGEKMPDPARTFVGDSPAVRKMQVEPPRPLTPEQKLADATAEGRVAPRDAATIMRASTAGHGLDRQVKIEDAHRELARAIAAPDAPAPAKKATPRKASPSINDAEAALASVTSRNDGRAALEGMQLADLKTLAKRLQVDSTGLNKADLREALVDATVGMRADHAGILSGDWNRDRFRPGLSPLPPTPRKASGSPAVAKLTPPKFDAAGVAHRLGSAESTESGRVLLADIKSRPDLQVLAGEVGYDVAPGESMAKIREGILRQAVTRRLEHEGYRRRARQADEISKLMGLDNAASPVAAPAASSPAVAKMAGAKAPAGVGDSVDGRTTAQLRQIAKAEGIPLPARGTRDQLAQAIRDQRFNRDNVGANVFSTPTGQFGAAPSPAVAKMTRGAAPKVPEAPAARAARLDGIAQQLMSGEDSEARYRAILAGVPPRDLRAVGLRTGVKTPAGLTADQVRDHIAHSLAIF
jgi:hypothetical protein